MFTTSQVLSESQLEALKLAGVVGNEVNTLSFSILFNSGGNASLLLNAAKAVSEHYPILHTQIDSEELCMHVKHNIDCVRALKSFASREQFDAWAKGESSKTVFADSCCADIYPVQIRGDTEGYYVRLHHMIADGWAATLLFNALSQCYHELMEGKAPCLDEDCPYSEFVSAEAAYYQSKRGQRDVGFWKQFLASHKDGKLLSDQMTGDFSSIRYTANLPSCIVENLKRVSRIKGKTIQSILITAIAAAYSRMEDAKTFTLGTLLHNRLNAREERIIGNCFTTVPLPVTISVNETFSSLNDGVTDALFAVLRRQRTSYTRIISQAFDTPPIKPLFDTLVNFQDYTSIDTSDTEFIWYPPAKQLETLQIGLIATKESLLVYYDYRPDCITQAKVEQFHARVTAVMEDVLAGDWYKPVADLCQIPKSHMRLLEKWNRTAHYYPERDTLYSLFEKRLALHREKTALFFQHESLTYHQFEIRVKALSSILSNLNVNPGDIVGIMAERSFDMMIGIYAIIRSGAAYMPIGIDTPQERVLFMLQDSECRVFLTQSHIRIDLPSEITRIDLNSIDYTVDAPDTPPLARPELPAYVIYTSGSTGMPKGVLISHRSIVDRIHWMNRMFPVQDTDVILQKTPYTFDVSVWELFWWSNYGASLAILPPEAHKDPEQIIQAVEKYSVTKMHFVPSMLSAFLAYAQASDRGHRLSSLRQVFASGEALMPAHVQKFYQLIPSPELINLYGPTECTVDVSYFRCPRKTLRSVPIGKPVDNTQLYVLDKDLRMLPIGAEGELCVTGNLVGIGYLKRPELTKERFADNPFGEGKLYRTGDLTCWNADGEIEYLGRMDFQVKLRGQRIELGEIERCMASISGVQEAVAMVQNMDNSDAELVAYYTGREEMPTAQIRAELERSLPRYMIPQGFLYLSEMPLTVSGKTDRKRLPVISLGKSNASDSHEAPETELQKKLCTAFAMAMHISPDSVGLSYHFFEHGGTSIRAIALLTELFSDYRIQLKDIYDNPTPKALAAFIEGTRCDANKVAEDDYLGELAYTHVLTPETPNLGVPAGGYILLTGATGFLGIHMLHELLVRFPSVSIICLVRNAAKLESCWQSMFDDEPFLASHVIPVVGDISMERLGLGNDEYEFCLNKISAVYHCAADVRHFGIWETSYSANTLGTLNVIELCLAAGAVLHHVSTMSVNGYVLTTMGDKLSDVFTENHLFVGQRFKENVYVHSKYLAEKAILEARERGLTANIYRVGNLLWRKRDGRFQVNRTSHDFYMLIHAFLELRSEVSEYCDFRFDLTAVDLCAQAICTLSLGNVDQIYHIRNPFTTTLHDYLAEVSDYSVRAISLNEFKTMLRKHASDPKYGFMLAYLSANENNRVDTFPEERCNKTLKALENHGFFWQAPSVRYMRYVL